MPRQPRIDIADNYYHCLNRASARLKINFNDDDFVLITKALFEAQNKFSMEILAFVIMGNHFHLVIKTKQDKQMSQFMKWFTLVHTKRWHFMNKTAGTGHLYQGRYNSFIIKDQRHLETVIRYVERNPLTANIVKNILDWKYSSLYQRFAANKIEPQIQLTDWPYHESRDYLVNLIEPYSNKEIEKALESEME